MAGKQSKENGKKGGRPFGSVSEKTKRAQAIRDVVTTKIEQDAEEIYEKAMVLVRGVVVEKKYTNKKGNVKTYIYTTLPSSDMIKYLMDQGMGRPVESMKFEDDNGPIPLGRILEYAINQAYGKGKKNNGENKS